MQISTKEISTAIGLLTLVFLLAPGCLLIYVSLYNDRKKRHIEEKAQMKLAFDAEIAKAQLEIQEQTLQTIGADLHDNIGQLLSLTGMTLNSISLDETDKAKEKIAKALDLTLRSVNELRLLGKLLQGEQLISMGLSKAITQELSWIEKIANFKIDYHIEGEEPETRYREKDLFIFRILQESLNNIIKHSYAKLITIKLMHTELSLQLQIRDDGVGFDLDDQVRSSGMGLENIKKRAGLIGGEALISASPGKGTCIDIFIPYA